MVNSVLQYALPGIAFVLAVGGLVSKSRRGGLWTAAVSIGLAGLAAHYGSFWTMVTLTMVGIWSIVMSLRAIDGAWRAKAGLLLVAFIFAVIAFWPTVNSMTAGKVWCPQYIRENVEFRLVAGLDLRGGLRLVYTVDVQEAIRDKRDRYYDEMRVLLTKALGIHEGDKPPTREEFAKLAERVDMSKPRAEPNAIVVTLKDPADAPKLETAFGKRYVGEMTVNRDATTNTFSYRIKTEVESGIRERAVTQAKETINRRVDELGLREAVVVVRDEDIIIEVPGEDESTFREIRDIISRTARLDFKLLDDDTDFVGQLAQKTKDQELPAGVSLDNIENAPTGPGKSNPIHYITVSKQENEPINAALDRVQKWMEQFEVPEDREIAFGKIYEQDPETFLQKERGWRSYFVFSRADVTGDQIQDAAAMPDQSQGSLGGWHVALTFTSAGGERFEEITGANIKRRFAIILDNKVASAPVIQTRIAGGHAQITMGAADPQTQLEESRQLELVLRSGALPAPITPSNEQRIGPSLGRDSITQGVRAAAIGGVGVLSFMVIYYSAAGLVANLAVLFNLLLQMSILASFGASMTLPGIAGLALTIGMSVDANVLINERIREELRTGKSARAAVEAGYDKAFSAIIDGNVTTLLAGLILAQYGTGPIKGFAITLIVGLLCSLFTTVFGTRVVFEFLVRGLRVKNLRIG